MMRRAPPARAQGTVAALTTPASFGGVATGRGPRLFSMRPRSAAAPHEASATARAGLGPGTYDVPAPSDAFLIAAQREGALRPPRRAHAAAEPGGRVGVAAGMGAGGDAHSRAGGGGGGGGGGGQGEVSLWATALGAHAVVAAPPMGTFARTARWSGEGAALTAADNSEYVRVIQRKHTVTDGYLVFASEHLLY